VSLAPEDRARRAGSESERNADRSRARSGPVTRLFVLVAFAAAMGWLEAVVVVYIRSILGIAHAAGYPAAAEILRQITRMGWLLPTEQTREAATIIMLAAVAWLTDDRWPARAGAFLIEFGVWDIVYYIGLRVLIGWPPSLTTMDLLFLIPPSPLWHQPIWVPVLISCGMIAWGTVLLLRPQSEARRLGR
jgi:hypothetical protein